jgi:diguanylate cyclase (GGDEF)-like protein
MAVHGTDAGAERGHDASPLKGNPEGQSGWPEGELGGPDDEDLGIRSRRDELASLRDEAAQVRDQLAVQRDIEADVADQRVLDLEGNDELLDRRTLRVQELRARGKTGRNRAARSRERAKRDRTLAGVDRASGEGDRQESKLDRELAATDELTGARRRGVGLEDLQREIDRARRTGETLVAAYVDVDGLKAVNDEHGHRAGDELLRDVVTRLRRDMRPYDLLMRLGGDEFLCVLSGVGEEEARRRFERLGTDLRGGPTVRSVSIGLGELRDGEGPQELVDRADQDLLAGRARTRRDAR